MDINSNSLQYFGLNGLQMIADSIEKEFERLLQEDYFEEDQQEFKKELGLQYDLLVSEDISTDEELYEMLLEVINWLNIPDNMEGFGSEGWEHACGLDSP